jgi:hypothetical protein
MSRINDDGTPKTVVQMGPSLEELSGNGVPSEVDDSILDGEIQTAADYGARVEARKAQTAALKQKKVPLGSVPSIPEEKLQELAQGLSPPVFDDDMPLERTRKPVEPPEGRAPSGVGSGFAVNQAMAAGELDRPVSLKEARQMEQDAAQREPERKPLSPETVEVLSKVKEANEGAAVESTKSDAETAVDFDMAEDQAVSEALQPPMDFGEIRRQVNVLLTKERKKAIEDRLGELNVADLVTKREIVQDIPVVVDKNGNPKLIYTLRTYRQHEYLHCLRHVYENPGSAVYIEELLNTCKMVCSLVSVNGGVLPEHRDNVGRSDEVVSKKQFENKLNHVAGLPVHIIADISVQWAWFNDRVNELFNIADLKNG